MMNEYEDQNDAIQEYWDSQRPLLETIKQKGGVANYVNSLASAAQFFNANNHEVCCIDERTTAGVIHFAGSGILDQDEAVQVIRHAGAQDVYSHAGCGAADLAFEKLSPDEKNKFANAEEYAKWWAKEVARKAGIEYKGHLPVEPNFHIARVAYYDGTGMCDAALCAKLLPLGFVISRRYLNKDYALKELDLSIQIAFGVHGFGKERFTQQTPFTIIPIADANNNRFSLEQLTSEAREVANQYGDSVSVDGFVAT